MLDFIKSEIQKLQTVLQRIEANPELLKNIQQAAEVCVASLRAGGKILFVGNGGSAADAQHLAAELVGRVRYDRPGLAAFALTTDTSALTAIGNDYAFADIFSRQVQAVGRKADVLVGLSTSGKSPNVLKAFEAARQLEMVTIGLTGQAGFAEINCDIALNVPSVDTCKIQEAHIMIGHIVCVLIENAMYGNKQPAVVAALTK